MCVADLNVSTQPCGHRWLRLVRPCHPKSNLANCKQKLKLEGWEQRKATCPWCNHSVGGSELHQSTHRILGGRTASASNVSTPSSVFPEASRRRSRSSSQGTLSSLSETTSNASDGNDRRREHRDRNDRLMLYLSRDPHEVLPSALKNYPSSPTEEVTDSSGGLPGTKAVSRGWRKGLKLGRGIFKA